MVQPLMSIDAVGTHRVGVHRGGLRQKYVLDDVGRRLLHEQYDGRTETIDHLMKTHFTPLGIPRQKVKAWACQLGLARQKEPRWSEKDEAYLERHLYKKSLGAIARQLGRTKTAISLRAKKLGLCKTQEGYTMRGLCLGLGCDHKAVTRWLEADWLKGARRQSERTARGDIWYFSDKNIRDFIANHPGEVDPRHADWLWLVDVLLGGEDGLGTLLRGHERREQSA